MTDRKRRFRISDIVELTENRGDLLTTTAYSETISGWVGGQAEIITTPALFKQGSYISEQRIPEREIEVVMWTIDHPKSLDDLIGELDTIREDFTYITLTRVKESETERKSETLQAKIRDVEELQRVDDYTGKIRVLFVATDPKKTVTTTAL